MERKKQWSVSVRMLINRRLADENVEEIKKELMNALNEWGDEYEARRRLVCREELEPDGDDGSGDLEVHLTLSMSEGMMNESDAPIQLEGRLMSIVENWIKRQNKRGYTSLNRNRLKEKIEGGTTSPYNEITIALASGMVREADRLAIKKFPTRSTMFDFALRDMIDKEERGKEFLIEGLASVNVIFDRGVAKDHHEKVLRAIMKGSVESLNSELGLGLTQTKPASG
jgi:predicted transcriptional regulator